MRAVKGDSMKEMGKILSGGKTKCFESTQIKL